MLLAAVPFAMLVAAVFVGVAGAAPSAQWSLRSVAYPSDFSAANDNARCEAEGPSFAHFICDTYIVTATNVGSHATNNALVTLKDTLPAGLEVRHVSLYVGNKKPPKANTTINEELSEDIGAEFCKPSPAECVLSRSLQPDGSFKMYVSVVVKEPATPGSLVNAVSVSGGGAPEVTASAVNTLEMGAPRFGASFFQAPFVGVDGLPDTQASAHPYELDTVFGVANATRETPEAGLKATSIEDVRDVIVDLPVGMAGSGVSAPRCTLARLGSKGLPEEVGESRQGRSGCPNDTIIGHLRTVPEAEAAANSPIYNLLPDKGHAAELGFIDVSGGAHVLYVSIVPTPAGYVLRTTSKEIPQLTLLEVIANIYGDPSTRPEDKATEPAPSTFTNPAHCTGEPLMTTVRMDSWQHPGSYNPDGTPNLSDPNWVSAHYESPPVTGCEALEGLFEPSITTAPSSHAADTPAGLDVNVTVPQHNGGEEPAVPPLRDTLVTLPAGVSVNPSSANGLQACSLGQIGISPAGVPDAAPPSCPDGSKIGTVELETPALAMEACKKSNVPLQECPEGEEREKTPLKGSIYVAKQHENPFGSLLAIYIVINDPRTGVVVKIPAEVKPDPVTGQLTTLVRDTPQFPFSELRTHFLPGPTASLRTPPTCGSYTLTSELTPWSAPDSGPPATPSGSFEITEGPSGNGTSCAHSPGEEPNSPSFQAGTSTPTAGAFSPLVVHLSREDGSQNFGQISVTLPPGASGRLAGIPQCSDAQIATALARNHPGEGALEASGPSCPASSAIGTVTVGAGAGPDPFYVTGKAYLAGPYKGAPFSGVFITPAIAGPFDLGTVVVRAGLYIDPNTARVTTTSDPLPSILLGIPLDIRSVTVDVDRPGFTLNPTNCNQLTVTGTETSTLGNTAQLNDRFQVGGCQNLKFAPSFTVSTAGKTSKANGASLSVKVAYPSGSLGTQSNIGRVDLQLPKQLPARLTTLQKACTEAQFNANPAGCPVASMIGTAKAITPLLNSPLVGPAILVSHGGAAFPDVEFLLQGEGVMVVLDGKTQIKKGITFSHFETVPDQPISTFETTFPQGPYSVLSTNLPVSAKYSLCGQSLTLPTTITAQDGAIIKQNTRATVTGCAKVKTLTRAQKLTAALKLCRKRDRSRKGRRVACERVARKKYGAVLKGKKRSRG
ncbi:MAG TPA: hypothetical protein VGH60_03865 [Solirubrobacteraceae bacterium]|jgi:uncharacterized repeat protein (TIGR01451 family)